MARRYGEGSVYQQRRDGRWVAVLRLPGEAPRYCTGPTRQAALERRDALRTRAGRGEADTSTQPLAAYLTQWQADQAARWQPTTQRHTAQLVRDYITPHLGAVRLRDLRPGTVQRWLTTLHTTGVPAPTQHRTYRVLRTALERAVRWDLLPKNPCRAVDPPPPPAPRTAHLGVEDARTLLTAIAPTRWFPIVALAIYTGMRRGEILGLRWQDVDFEAGILHVRHALTGQSRATFALQAPKTARSTRDLTLAPDVAAILRAQRRHQQYERDAATRNGTWQEIIPHLVFTAQTGAPYDGCRVSHTFRELCAAADVPVLPFHGLRHTAVSLLMRQVALPVLLAQFGWANATMLTTVYAHPNAADLAAAGQALQDTVGLDWAATGTETGQITNKITNIDRRQRAKLRTTQAQLRAAAFSLPGRCGADEPGDPPESGPDPTQNTEADR